MLPGKVLSRVQDHALLIIILIGAIFRLYHISTTPISLNPDELALGYNAYSLLTTGADEWGNKVPISLKSFGDWKLPVYPLTTIPAIKIFGLNEFSVRLPAAVAGIVLIGLIYNISLLLFKNKKIALISALFMAVSPWAVFFSRGAYEPNLALSLSMAGLFFFLKYVNNQRDAKYITASAVCFGLTLFTYHSFLIFTPLSILVLLIFYFKDLKNWKKLLTGGAILSIFGLVSLYSLSLGSSSKISTVGIFNDPDVIYRRAERLRADPENELVKKLLYNKGSAVVYEVAQNYILTFSPAFLFDGKTTKLFYSIGSFGYLYLLDAVFIFFGLVGLIYNRERNGKLLFLLLAVAPISSAITIEAPSITRLIQIVPLLALVGSYGAYFIYTKADKFYYKLGFAGLVLLLFINVIYFLDSYFVHMNYQNARFLHYGYKEIVEVSRKYPDYKVVVVGPQNFPYISFLFYDKYDPGKFRREVKYYPPSKEKFYFVKSFGRYTFVYDINRTKLQKNTLYIDNYVEGDKRYIKYPTGEPQFSYFTKDDL
ncbi:MAG: glycosyltransferase family 39 protein [Patescibacteria group bacterium]